MKKKLILIACLAIALLAILVTSAFRKPFGSDMALVGDATPLALDTHTDPAGKRAFVHRTYVLNLPFDKVVNQLNRQLVPDGWKANGDMMERMFDKDVTEEYVQVSRELLIAGHFDPEGERRVEPYATYIDNPRPDPRGWITVTTCRELRGPQAVFTKLRMKLGWRNHYEPETITVLEQVLQLPTTNPNLRAIERPTCRIEWITE